jgi:cytochrome bd-type quinol oxidase subunit 2
MSKTKFQENKKKAKKSGNSKPGGHNVKKSAHKERKWYLSLVILLVLVAGLFSTFWVLNETRVLNETIANWPWWAWAIFVTNVADIIAAVALWQWKKWGLWLYLVSVASRTILMVTAGAFGTGFASFLPFAIVGYAVSLNWKQFE